ncbi:superoxide dismutase, Ni [Candidatus Uhrbacteria bacterium]|nr:superoxide dismutase, Ni [Candidatus Uhrbacteria bacterium]
MQSGRSILAEAHCDIPCGIYEPVVAKIAAKTVARMVDQIQALELPLDQTDKAALDHYQNALNRRLAVKENHAETCKREIETLWSDFLKPEHLEQFPRLHETVWQTLKVASTCKQEINSEAAHQLVTGVDEIARIFYTVKQVPDRLKAYQELTDHLD